MSRWVGVGGWGWGGIGGEPILIEKNASSSKKAPRIYAGVTCKAHKHLSSLNN